MCQHWSRDFVYKQSAVCWEETCLMLTRPVNGWSGGNCVLLNYAANWESAVMCPAWFHWLIDLFVLVHNPHVYYFHWKEWVGNWQFDIIYIFLSCTLMSVDCALYIDDCYVHSTLMTRFFCPLLWLDFVHYTLMTVEPVHSTFVTVGLYTLHYWL